MAQNMKRKVVIALLIVTMLITIGLYYQENFYLQSMLRHSSTHRQILQITKIDQDNNNNNEIIDDDEYKLIEETDPVLDKFVPENVPYFYLHDTKQLHESYNKTCAGFPSLHELEYNNDLWQVLETSNGTFELWNAFLDNRTLNSYGSTIRILAMINRYNPIVKTYCQIRFDHTKKPLIVPVAEYFFIWHPSWGTGKPRMYRPYVISCHITEKYRNLDPVSVSLVEKPCNKPLNSLKVIYNEPLAERGKQDFVVCVKGLNFPYEDKTLRLVEWIELLNLLGADKIVFYEFQSHPTTKKLLNYYTKQGKIEVNTITLSGNSPNSAYLQNIYLQKRTMDRRFQEVIPYNDCFYKNMYRYRYVILMDIDEVIVPVEDTWHELLEILEKSDSQATAYAARNVYFLDSHQHDHGWFKNIPKYMHMLQHVYRSVNYTQPGYYIKCFLNTERVMALHNHYPRACLSDSKSCRNVAIDTKLAHMQHYRSDCVRDLGKRCESLKNNSVIDTRVWRFKDELINRTEITLKDLGLLVEV